jgi:hypothetical protein
MTSKMGSDPQRSAMQNDTIFEAFQPPGTVHMGDSLATRGGSKMKIKFTAAEDQRLIELVARMGDAQWSEVAKAMGRRTLRQCRERWKNYLSPAVTREPWSSDEDRLLVKLVEELGRQWSVIAEAFPLRTNVNVKNRWAALAPSINEMKRIVKFGDRKKKKKKKCLVRDDQAWAWHAAACTDADEVGNSFHVGDDELLNF